MVLRRRPDGSRRYLRSSLTGPLLFAIIGILLGNARAQDNSSVGQWSPVMTWPYEAIHAHVLPTGKVIFWTRGDHSQL